MGMVFTTLRNQASVLAYADVFLFCAAFAVIPLTFLFRSVRKVDGDAPVRH